jgi:hypothetical protein
MGGNTSALSGEINNNNNNNNNNNSGFELSFKYYLSRLKIHDGAHMQYFFRV